MLLSIIIIGSVVTVVCFGCFLYQQYISYKALESQKQGFNKQYIKNIQERCYKQSWRFADKTRVNIILGKTRNPGSIVILKSNAENSLN